MRASTQGKPGSYEGVLRDEKGHVVWSCGHGHRNRGNDSHSGPYGVHFNKAALSCAREELQRRKRNAA